MRVFYFASALLLGVANMVSAKVLTYEINEKTKWSLSVDSKEIKRDVSGGSIVFVVRTIPDSPVESQGIKFRSIYTSIQLNCGDGSGEVSSADYYSGADSSTDKVLYSKSRRISNGEAPGALPRPFASIVCEEAKEMDLISEVGAVLKPEPLPGGDQPPTLELRVIQSRLYDTTMKIFFDAFKEMCENNGGSFIGHLNERRDTKLYCGGSKSKIFRNFKGGLATIACELQADASNRVMVRLRVKDGFSSPAYNKLVYTEIFSEISNTLGVLSIPIEVRAAE